MEDFYLKAIIEGYSWIKVKKYDEVVSENKDYNDLLSHHRKETEFLINKCRELAALLIDKGARE